MWRTAWIVLGAHALIAVAVAAWAPRLLLALGAVWGLGALGMAWRACPGFGRTRALPPGSLAVLPSGSWRELWFYRDLAARHGPVFKTSYLVRPMVCVMGLGRGLALLREHQGSLETSPVGFSRFIPRGFLRYMEPAPHEMYRALFRRVLARDVVDAWEPEWATEVRATLRAMAAADDPASRPGIAPPDHLDGLVFRGFVRLFLGLPSDSLLLPGLRRHFETIDIRNPRQIPDREVLAALEALERILRAQAATFAAARADAPVPRCFLAELWRAHPEALDDPTVTRNLVYMLYTGGKDVTGLLGWVLRILADHPEWVERLGREVDAGDVERLRASDSLASRTVLECLRLEQSEYLHRTALADLRFGGLRIPKGWLVRICVRESHQDPAVFEAPDHFDPDRFLGRRYGPEEFSPFGLHRFTCLGDHLTRTAARVFAAELARDYVPRVVVDGPREFGSWQHWKPSDHLRVALAPRTAGMAAGGDGGSGGVHFPSAAAAFSPGGRRAGRDASERGVTGERR
jgi:cytochrome P450